MTKISTLSRDLTEASSRLLQIHHQVKQAEADRLTLQELLRSAQDERLAEERRGADPVVLCHHVELQSLLLRRLAETELRVVESRIEAGRYRAILGHATA